MMITTALFVGVVALACGAVGVALVGVVLTACGIRWEDLQ